MYRPDNAWEAYGMELAQLVDTMGFMGLNTMEFPTETGYASLIDEEAEIHILYGDAPGSGGHAPGTGMPGKSEFPVGWTNEDILTAVSDVATDPTSRATIQGNTTIIDGTRLDVVEGKYIDIRVYVRDGRIAAAHPTNVPRNP